MKPFLSQYLHDRIVENDGISYNVVTDSEPSRSGYMVSLQDHERIAPLTPLEIDKYLSDKESVLNSEDVFFGAWKDGDNYVYDVSVRVFSREVAIKLGIANNQKAIYDLNIGQSIPLPATV